MLCTSYLDHESKKFNEKPLSTLLVPVIPLRLPSFAVISPPFNHILIARCYRHITTSSLILPVFIFLRRRARPVNFGDRRTIPTLFDFTILFCLSLLVFSYHDKEFCFSSFLPLLSLSLSLPLSRDFTACIYLWNLLEFVSTDRR